MKFSESRVLTPSDFILSEGLPDLYIFLTTDLVILNATDSYLQATQRIREDITGKYFFDVFPDYSLSSNANTNKNLLDSFNEIIRSRKPGKIPVQRYDILLPDGKFAKKYWAPANTPVLNDLGQVIYLIHRVEDVTNLVAQEEKVTDLENIRAEILKTNEELTRVNREFRFVTDFMPQMVWATQADGYHDFFNKGWYEYTGLTYEDTKDKGWSLVLHPDDYEKTWQIWNHSLRTGETYEIEYRMRKYDGSYRWFLARAVPLRDEDGHILKWFGTCTDIHDRMLTEERLAYAQKELSARNMELNKKNVELTRINNDLDNFIYTASHDLKAPVSNIEGLIHALLDVLDSESRQSKEVKQVFSLMENSVARFKRTIQELTEITKTQKNIEENTEIVSCREIVEDVIETIKEMVVTARAKITLDVDDCLDIRFSKKNLKSIIFNLLSNAIKYRDPERSLEVLIKTEQAENHIVMTVQDNGLGMNLTSNSKILHVQKVSQPCRRLRHRTVPCKKNSRQCGRQNRSKQQARRRNYI